MGATKAKELSARSLLLIAAACFVIPLIISAIGKSQAPAGLQGESGYEGLFASVLLWPVGLIMAFIGLYRFIAGSSHQTEGSEKPMQKTNSVSAQARVDAWRPETMESTNDKVQPKQ